MKVTIPIAVKNESNQHTHWRHRATRAKAARGAAALRLKSAMVKEPLTPLLVVVLTRVSPKELDSDGVVAALKSVRDGVADALHCDDRTQLIRWEYAQRKGEPSVEIELHEARDWLSRMLSLMAGPFP